jgi:hypothetical protein
MGLSRPEYRPIKAWTHEAVEEALAANDPDLLLHAVIAVSTTEFDWRFAQSLCVRLASHEHCNVRGNAVLGFGHIARVHGHLERAVVQPIISAALHDEEAFVRQQAQCAREDTMFFLNWHYPEKRKA